MIEFRLPSLGADMDQGKLLEWKVAPGDTVSRGQVVAIVDTAKAAVDVEIWSDGIVDELLVEPGATIPVGTVLATLRQAGEAAAARPARPAAAPPGPTATAAAAPPVAAPAPTPPVSGRRRVSPAARKLAEEMQVDVDAVAGTGPDAAVTLDDVRAAAARAAPAAKPADRNAEMRKAIAAAMSRSKREIPHYYLAETVPLDAAIAWLSRANAERPLAGRLLLAVLQLKAVALATRRFPDMNGFCIDGRFTPAPEAHLGVAIALRQGGLIAPALHDVADKSLDELMRDLADLVKRARAGSLRSSEMSDPTLTVTNLGDQGVESVFGVIYPPQVALVGFGRVVDRPLIRDGGLHIVPAVVASLAADHRVSDGHRGALFLAEIRELLQHPEQL